jgi:predicted Zn-dependent protease
MSVRSITTRSRAGRGLRRLKHSLLGAGALATALVGPLASIAQAQESQPRLIEDTEINDILHKECDPVFVAAGINPRDMRIVLIQDRELNAGTASTKLIGINTGLIAETKNPGELIGVMAHETGHAAGGHTVRGEAEMQRAAMNPLLLTLGLGLLAIAAGAPDAGAALLGSSGYFATLGALGYSREQESRADQAAVTYLEKAGESAKGLVDFFDNFRYQEVFEEARRYPFFQTHPISSDRVESLRRRAEEQPHYNTPDKPELIELHEVMKAKLLAFTQPAQQTFLKYPETDTSYPARYARAIAYYRETEPEIALKQVDALLTEQPNNPYLWELKGQILFEAGRAKESEPAHRKSVELRPTAPLLQINLARAILAQEDGKRADEAIQHLQKALAFEPDNAFAFQLMAQAYDAKGEGGQARLASAEERYAVGDLVQARIFALRAREILPKNTPEWRRATDIVLVAKPTKDDLRQLGGS